MDLIFADGYGQDLAIVDFDFDIQIGINNTFEISVPIDWFQKKKLYEKATYVYVIDDDTQFNEFAGIITSLEHQTEFNQLLLRGVTMRDFLLQSMTAPDQSDGYAYTIAGDAQAVINDIMSRWQSSNYEVFEPTTAAAGFTLTRKRLPRFCSVEEAIYTALSGSGYIPIVSCRRNPHFRFTVTVVANSQHVCVVTDTDKQYGADAVIESRSVTSLPVVCGLGQGELTKRYVYYCWYEEDMGTTLLKESTSYNNTPLSKNYMSVPDAACYVIDNNNASPAELRNACQERLEELSTYNSRWDISNAEVDGYVVVGDTLQLDAGYLGKHVRKVTGKILRRIDGVVYEEYVLDSGEQVFFDTGSDPQAVDLSQWVNRVVPYYNLDTSAASGTLDGDLYAAIDALGWTSEVIV